MSYSFVIITIFFTWYEMCENPYIGKKSDVCFVSLCWKKSKFHILCRMKKSKK